ncbi:hypothetical protein AB2N08_16260 [Massilia aurea]|uniref:hypothetical protein n=1 Tax=Massilia aurea TaxID=373040 RepID=UPI0034620C5C
MCIVMRAALGATLLLSGCSMFDKSRDEYDEFADKHSAYQLLPREQFEPIDLASLISGNDPSTMTFGAVGSIAAAENRKQGALIDKEFAAFADKYRDGGESGRARRSAIQERILAASDQRCNDFKTLLQKKFSNVSFKTGLLSSITAVAATVVSSVDTSKALAGVAGISSAYRAEYNQAYFANAAVQVVVAGIDSRRRTAYEQILLARNESLAAYPLEAAVKDAIRYHGLCSTVSGLQEAGEAVRYYNEPGITAATRTLARSKMMTDIQGASADQVLERIKHWNEVIPAERYLAGNPLGTTLGGHKLAGAKLIDSFVHTLASIRRHATGVGTALKDLSADFVPAADIETAGKVGQGVEKVVTDGCEGIVQKRAANLDLLTAKLALATNPGEDQLQLDVKRAIQSAEMARTGFDFVTAAYHDRAATLQRAIGEHKRSSTKDNADAVKRALSRWNAFMPAISAECEVQKLE